MKEEVNSTEKEAKRFLEKYSIRNRELLVVGSMPFSVELDITNTDGLARQPVASQAAAGWRAGA